MGITSEGDYYFALRTGLTDIFTAPVDWSSGRLRSKPERLPTRFPGVNSAADWSRDGERIGFLSVRGSENYGEATRIISIRELKGGTERDLRTRMAQVEQLEWSPDGASLLVSGIDRRGRSGLFLVDTATGRTSDVVVGSGEIHGVWAKDGRSVFYLSGNEIRRRPLEGEAGSASLVHRHDTPVSRPALSPDGARLAFACRHGEILLLPLNAGAVEDSRLVRTTAPERGHLTGLAWTPDGRRLLLSIRNDDRESVWMVAAGGSDGTKLELPAGIRGPVRLHPDGRTIAFAAGSPKTEIWRLRTLASKHGTQQ
jgi:Tol biopolymer transport system component